MLGNAHSPLRTTWTLLVLVVFLLTGRHGLAGDAQTPDGALEIERLKGEVAALSQELIELQQAAFYPADTRFFLFLSLASNDGLTPESIEIAIDGRPVVSHLYSEREKLSLQRGGAQALYTGNLSLGEHRLDITLAAQAQNDRYVRRESSLTFRKRAGETTIELQLAASSPDFEPSITLQDWQ